MDDSLAVGEVFFGCHPAFTHVASDTRENDVFGSIGDTVVEAVY